MTFHSYLFIFLFLPLFLLFFGGLGLLNRKKISLGILLTASLLFYFYSQGAGICFLLGSVAVNYLFLVLLSRDRKKSILAVGILFQIVFLSYFKYTDFFLTVLNTVFRTNLQIPTAAPPLGISFFTFQQIAFLVDVYRSEVALCNPFEYAAYISFFPHISQGPILTGKSFLPSITELKAKLCWEDLSAGLFLFSLGLGKKVLLADAFGRAVDAAYADLGSLNITSALFVSLAYTLQIYFDFSGYCDMAYGVARMIGFELPVNFNSPYKAESVPDFWNRWHITLTKFFTKYLYIPLGGSRKGTMRTMVNTMIVFAISGLWHGASYTFIAWGLLHGIAMVLTKQCKALTNRIPKVLCVFFTFLFVNFTWIPFRAGSFSILREYLRAFTVKGVHLTEAVENSFSSVLFWNLPSIPNEIKAYLFLLLGLGIVFFAKNTMELLSQNKWKWTSAVITVLLLLLSVYSLSGTTSYLYLDF